MEFCVEFSNLNIKVSSIYDYTYNFCKEYLSDKAPDFEVATTEEKISKEIEVSDFNPPRGYAESICVYREIAKQTVDLNLKKGKVAVVPFTFKGKLPYGSYQIFSSLHPRITTGAFVRDWNQQPETIRFSRIKRGDESYLSAAKFVAVPKPRKKTDEGFRIGTTGSYTPAGDRYIMSDYGPTEKVCSEYQEC